MDKIQNIVMLGASKAFFEISDIVRDINSIKERYKIIAALDDDYKLHGKLLEDVPVAGGLDMVSEYPEAKFVFAIGSFRNRLARYNILKRLNIDDERFITLIHPNAKVYPSVKVGPGCIIHSGTVICHDAVLEPFSIVTFNSCLGPYSYIGRCAMVTTLVTILTGVRIGSCAFIGSASCIAEGVKIGPGAMVGMATPIYRNVPPGAYILGNPARVLYSVQVPDELLVGW